MSGRARRRPSLVEGAALAVFAAVRRSIRGTHQSQHSREALDVDDARDAVVHAVLDARRRPQEDDNEVHHGGEGIVVGWSNGAAEFRSNTDHDKRKRDEPLVIGKDSRVEELRCLRAD